MTSRDLTNKLIAKSLLCIYSSSAVSFGLAPLNAIASSKKHHKQQEQTQTETESAAAGAPRSATKTDEALGLDPQSTDLVNQGDWQGLSERLAKLQADGHGTEATKADTWLAFAYMYLNKCTELEGLEKKLDISDVEPANSANTSSAPGKVESGKSTADPTAANKSAANKSAANKSAPLTVPPAAPYGSFAWAGNADHACNADHVADKHERVTIAAASSPAPTSVNSTIIKAYHQMCHHDLAGADQTLSSLKGKEFADSVAVNYALAAISGKLEHFSDAAAYTQKTVELAPDFAWGYRTLGLIYHRFLHDDVRADAAFVQALKIEPQAREVRDTLIDMRLSKNDFDGAIDQANEAIRTTHDAASHYKLAQIYIQQWRLREALAELQTAISMDSHDARFYRSRASIKRYQGDLDGAIADETSAVANAKDKAFELGELASMNLLANHKKEAIENLQEALKVDANNKSLRDRLVVLLGEEKRYDELVQLYRTAIASHADDASLHLGLARCLEKSGKIDAAVEEYKAAANLNPNDPEPHRDLGALWIVRRDFGAAAKEYTRALSINPSSVPDLVALGYCYAQNDDFLQAEAAFVTSLALQQLTQFNGPTTGPTRLQINRSLAGLLFEEGRYSDAAAQLEAIYSGSKNTADGQMDNLMLAQAKALRDLSAASARALVDAYKALPPEKQGQSKSAVVETLLNANKIDLALDIAHTGQTSDPLAELDLAKAYRLKGDWAKAAELASPMVANKSFNNEQQSDVLEELAQIALGKGDLAKSEDYAKQALAAYSKNYNAYETMGRIYLKQNKHKEALDAANKAIAINPYFTRGFLLLGDVQRSAGSLKEASASYKKAAELYPGLLEAHKALLTTFEKMSLRDDAKREAAQIAEMEKQR